MCCVTEVENLRTPIVTHVRKRRNRWFFVAAAVVVLMIGGGFALATTNALSIRAHTGSEFSTYVVDHHIGRVTIQTDSSGLETDFCVLHLDKPIAEDKLADEAFHLMTVYHSLDGGNTLSIEYQSSGGNTDIQASVFYSAPNETVSLELHEPDGLHIVKRKVNWSPDTYGD